MLKRIIDDIEKSIQNECFMAALALALTVPDICGKAEYPNAKTTFERYTTWYEEFIGQYEKPIHPHAGDMPYLSGELVYNLRNAFLHQGNPNIDKKRVKEERCKVDRFILTISKPHDGGFASMSIYGKNSPIIVRVLEVNIVNLCSKLVAVAKSYYDANKEKFDFFEYEFEDLREV